MEKTVPSMETRSVLAMSYILEDYKKFGDIILEAQKKTKNRDFSYDLLRVSQGKTIIGGSAAKKVYNENKGIIDTINEHGYISNFIMCNYCWGNEYDAIADYFYNYLIANKENIEEIRATLRKLVELKFEKVELDTGLDFTSKTYRTDTSIYHSMHINYLANMEVVPMYQSGIVYYKTQNSPYEIELSTSLGKITEYGRKIKLNTLIFDPNLIPSNIDNSLFDEIVSLGKSKQPETTAIRNSVDLSIAIEDLQYMIESTFRAINTIEDEQVRLNLIESGTKMLEELGKMKIERDVLESRIKQSHPTITEDKLTLEKKLYKQRRDFASIDLC